MYACMYVCVYACVFVCVSMWAWHVGGAYPLSEKTRKIGVFGQKLSFFEKRIEV